VRLRHCWLLLLAALMLLAGAWWFFSGAWICCRERSSTPLPVVYLFAKDVPREIHLGAPFPPLFLRGTYSEREREIMGPLAAQHGVASLWHPHTTDDSYFYAADTPRLAAFWRDCFEQLYPQHKEQP